MRFCLYLSYISREGVEKPLKDKDGIMHVSKLHHPNTLPRSVCRTQEFPPAKDGVNFELV